MTLLIILLDYKFRENVTDAVGTGGQMIRRTFFLIPMFIALTQQRGLRVSIVVKLEVKSRKPFIVIQSRVSWMTSWLLPALVAHPLPSYVRGALTAGIGRRKSDFFHEHFSMNCCLFIT
jgi:hypothetical protein